MTGMDSQNERIKGAGNRRAGRRVRNFVLRDEDDELIEEVFHADRHRSRSDALRAILDRERERRGSPDFRLPTPAGRG